MLRKKKRKPDITTVVPIDQRLIATIYKGNRSRALEQLSKLNIPFPAKLPDIDSEHQFPVDITRINNNELREKLSYWASQFARVNALLGLARGRRKKLDRYVDRQKKILFKMRAPTGTRSKYVDAIWGEVQATQSIARLERMYDTAIEMEEALEALAKDFSKYVEILQADLMWRQSEMKLI